jgi:hypothetical protein
MEVNFRTVSIHMPDQSGVHHRKPQWRDVGENEHAEVTVRQRRQIVEVA